MEHSKEEKSPLLQLAETSSSSSLHWVGDPVCSQAALQTPGTAGDTAATLSGALQALHQPQISSLGTLRREGTHWATANLLVGDKDFILVLHGFEAFVQRQVHNAVIGAHHGVAFPNSQNTTGKHWKEKGQVLK